MNVETRDRMSDTLSKRLERTDRVEKAFSRHAGEYEKHARVQREAAERLARALDPWREGLPDGPVLEIGAGTGYLSRHLDRFFVNRDRWFTDLSPKMLEQCRASFRESDTVGRRHFLVHDAERGWFDPNVDPQSDKRYRPSADETPEAAWEKSGPWSLITGSFVAQWFTDPSVTISRLLTGLKPGGLLLMAMPGHESFPEWRERCEASAIPWSANALPETERLVIQCTMGPFQADYYEEPYRSEHSSSLDFFRELKEVGASTPLSKRRSTPAQFRKLIQQWDESTGNAPVQVTWHLLFLAIRRDR